MLRTARAHGKPPSHWLYGNRGDWSERDYVLTLVLTKWEQGLCSCGQPIAVAHHPDNDGWYDPKVTQCHSCAEMERHTGSKDYRPDAGEKLSTKYTRPGSKPLPPWPKP